MINVLSLFDGLSGARIALDKLGIECTYYASEVDKYAIKVAQANYPDTIQLGDVTQVKASQLPKIDLLIGGSPCQDLSVAKVNREGLAGARSGLFWEYIRLLRELKPKYFVLENVYSMKATDRNIISREVGCSPMMINSDLVTAQHRKRYYWHNTGVWLQPIDHGIFLSDIIVSGFVNRSKGYALDACYYKGGGLKNYLERSRRQIVFEEKVFAIASRGRNVINGKRRDIKGSITQQRLETSLLQKSNCLTSVEKDSLVCKIMNDEVFVRSLYPIECERLQGVPDNYTDYVSDSQQKKMLGNGYSVPVIMHILKGMQF